MSTARRSGEDPDGTSVKESVRDAAAGAKEVIGQETRRTASDIGGQVKDSAASTVHEQKQRVSEGLSGIADQIQSLVAKSDDDGTVTQLLDEAEVRLRSAVDWVDSRSPDDLLDEVRAFARRRPGTFLVSAALAGAVVGRLTRTTATRVVSDIASSTGTSSVAGNGQARPLASSEPAGDLSASHPVRVTS
jgi:hypothetical protein